ncbi:MAG: ABC transporter permease [Gammaproteobacteria bacterium]|nr:ABC transporter permease [Gammaproteobacteria bacterium]
MIRFSSWLLLVTLVVGWELFCRYAEVSELLAPSPLAVLETLWSGLTVGFLWPHIWVTTVEVVIGLVGGCALGFLTGLLLGEVEFLRRLLYPYVLATQVIPKLALGPLFVMWFGTGIVPTVVITTLICFFPLLENTLTGVQQVEREKRELFRALGATRLQTLLRLKVPNSLPVILAGVRVAVVLAFIGAVVGEFIGANQGLGALIIGAQGMMDTTLMFAVFIVITVQGMLFYQATIVLERWFLRHHHF